jgi:hypothetical protein
MSQEIDFDTQAAWLRRFRADAESNLHAFARRLKEAMPDLVTIHESRGLFSSHGKVTGVTVELGEHRYGLHLAGGRLEASIAMVVRGITLNTKTMDPGAWFAALTEQTRNASDHARSLSASISEFMAS